MEQREMTQIIDNVVDSMVEKVGSLLGDRIVSITLVGSHAVGKISLSRPDIDFMIFFKERAEGSDFWKLGQIWNELNKQFSDDVNLRLEFRPFRFIYPRRYDKSKPDLYFNPIYANMLEKDLHRPFGLPKFVLAGFQQMRKVIIGEDVLGEMNFQFSVKELKNDMIADLILFYLQASRATAQYDLEKECNFLFNEALALGKFCTYCGIELAMSEQELQDKKHLKLLENKEKIPDFYVERYGPSIGDMVKFVYLARDNHSTWQYDTEKVRQLYNISLALFGVVMEKCH